MKRIASLWLCLLVILWVLLVPRDAFGQPSGPMPREVGWEPRAGQRAPVDVALTGEDGRPARIADHLADGRPVILVMAYYECPMLCSLVMNGLVSSLRKTGLTAGRDFEVVVVSIDPLDTPAKAAAKKAAAVRAYERPEAETAFHFLVGGEAEVREVARGVGFEYEYDPIGKQYAHAAGVVLLSGEGTITHYLYGADVPPRDLRLGLVESAGGAIGDARDELLLLCFRYDPARGRYGALAMTSMRAGGAITVLALGISLIVLGRRGRRPGAEAPGRRD